MKTKRWLCGLLSLLFVLSACDGSKKSSPVSVLMKRATGWPYEVLVVMDQDVWKGEAGRLLHDELTVSIPWLPQNEPTMRITYAEPQHFDGLLRYVRNIIQVQVDSSLYTKVFTRKETDRWASGQEVLSVYAPSSLLLAEYFQKEGASLVAYLGRKELERRAAALEEAHSSLVSRLVEERFHARLFAPEEMCSYKDTTDFFWVTDHGRNGRMDFVVYSFPYTDARTFTLDYLVAKRDSVLGVNIPGAYPNSYMTTEKRFAPSFTAVEKQGTYCAVVRGLWEMEGDMMGGPFVSHACLDEKRQRVIVAEAFVYAPHTTKANLMRRAEASLWTFRVEE